MFLAPVPKHIPATVSNRGTVTLPREVKRHLGLSKSDKVQFVIELDGTIRIERDSTPSIEFLRGIAGSLDKPMAWKEMRELAWQDHIEHEMHLYGPPS